MKEQGELLVKVGKCPRRRKVLRKRIRKQLYKHGDIPRDIVADSTSKKTHGQWEAVCDRKGRILSAGRVEKSDWYEYTMKNLFTVPRARGKGVAKKVIKKLVKKAERKGAKVITADITSSNTPSKVACHRAGLRTVSTFKWRVNSKPADVMQKIVKNPTKKEIEKVNRRIKREMAQRDKPTPTGILSKKI